MRVAIAGGTGFVGQYLIEALLARGHRPVLLVRPGSETKVPRPDDCDLVAGDLSDDEALVKLVDGCEAVVYLIGILREAPRRGITFEAIQHQGARRVIEGAEAAGARRLLLMSANGVRRDGVPYQRSKFLAEEAARRSRLRETVFRPSVIFGDPRGEMEIGTQLLQQMVRPPLPAANFFRAFGEHRGPVRMSPAHVADVADAFVAALGDESTAGRCYELGGTCVLTWGEMIRRVAAAAGRRKWLLPVPIELMYVAAALLDWLPVFPVTRDQLRMLAEDNVAPAGDLARLTGRAPRGFVTEELAYLARD